MTHVSVAAVAAEESPAIRAAIRPPGHRDTRGGSAPAHSSRPTSTPSSPPPTLPTSSTRWLSPAPSSVPPSVPGPSPPGSSKRKSRYVPRSLVQHSYTDRSGVMPRPPPPPLFPTRASSDCDGNREEEEEGGTTTIDEKESDDGTTTSEKKKNKKKRKNGATPAFPTRLHKILTALDPSSDEDGGRDPAASAGPPLGSASWHPHGRSFVVRDPSLFSSVVLPRYFGVRGRGMKLSSFQRQLNLYGFTRISSGPDKGGYYHEYFLRGRPYLVSMIQRIRIKGSGVRSASNPDQEPDFYGMTYVRALPSSFFPQTTTTTTTAEAEAKEDDKLETTADNRAQAAESVPYQARDTSRAAGAIPLLARDAAARRPPQKKRGAAAGGCSGRSDRDARRHRKRRAFLVTDAAAHDAPRPSPKRRPGAMTFPPPSGSSPPTPSAPPAFAIAGAAMSPLLLRRTTPSSSSLGDATTASVDDDDVVRGGDAAAFFADSACGERRGEQDAATMHRERDEEETLCLPPSERATDRDYTERGGNGGDAERGNNDVLMFDTEEEADMEHRGAVVIEPLPDDSLDGSFWDSMQALLSSITTKRDEEEEFMDSVMKNNKVAINESEHSSGTMHREQSFSPQVGLEVHPSIRLDLPPSTSPTAIDCDEIKRDSSPDASTSATAPRREVPTEADDDSPPERQLEQKEGGTSIPLHGGEEEGLIPMLEPLPVTAAAGYPPYDSDLNDFLRAMFDGEQQGWEGGETSTSNGGDEPSRRAAAPSVDRSSRRSGVVKSSSSVKEPTPDAARPCDIVAAGANKVSTCTGTSTILAKLAEYRAHKLHCGQEGAGCHRRRAPSVDHCVHPSHGGAATRHHPSDGSSGVVEAWPPGYIETPVGASPAPASADAGFAGCICKISSSGVVVPSRGRGGTAAQAGKGRGPFCRKNVWRNAAA